MGNHGEVILVAVDASKEITDYALQWAVQNVIKSKYSLILLAILPSPNCPPLPPATNHNVYNFLSRLVKKRSNGMDSCDRNGFVVDGSDMPQRIYNVCAGMIQQLFKQHNVVKVATQVKVVAYAPVGSIAMAAAELGATWVIIDRRLKKESGCCLKQLNCNIILIDHAIPKILKSTVKFPMTKNSEKILPHSNPTVADMLGVIPTYSNPSSSSSKNQSSSGSYTTKTDTTIPSSSSSTNKDSFPEIEPIMPQEDIKVIPRSTKYSSKSQPLSKTGDIIKSSSGSSSTLLKTKTDKELLLSRQYINKKNTVETTTPFPPRRSVDSRLLESQTTLKKSTFDRTSSIRRAMSVSIKEPQIPPPLCSVCKHNAPVFGRAPRKFSYSELKEATDGFSADNFLAKGGYGRVYKGVLGDGQVVAVKQHEMLNAQGASEFCSEVEVLSCAQHKNLVMLVGYCIEIEWLLVYEFACNGSLDKHLYSETASEVMGWEKRMKVAIGSARGLRYLHEDCRVGCIVHRDFRPNNILLTHDYEPMVGDFGLARWQVDGQSGEETRVIGAFGYLAPEYTQTGLVTEKADVYAFGVVLLELLTGIKATEFSKNFGQQYFPHWSGLFLEGKECAEIIDRRLENKYVVKEVESMMHAATLCISPHPQQRPRMSKILKILEGDHIPSNVETGRVAFTNQRRDLNGYTRDRKHNANRKQIQWNNRFKREMITDYRNLDQAEIVNDNYQEYLQGSLSRYIQNLNVR